MENLWIGWAFVFVNNILSELQIVVECEGKQHYKKANEKRDKFLLNEYGISKVVHIKAADKRKQIKRLFKIF